MFAQRRIIASGLICFFTLAIMLPGLVCPSSAWASDEPTVTTKSATGIGTNEAVLNAEIDDVGDSDIKEYGFYWGTDEDPENEGEREKVGTRSLEEGDTFKFTLEDLDEDTRYYFVAYAKNDDGTDFGKVKSFITDEDEDEDEDEEAPTVTTNSASDIEDDEATLNGVIDDIGGSDIEEYGFYWGTDRDPVDEGKKKKVGTKSLEEGDDFYFTLTDLDEGEKYYFVAYAKNDDGTDYGSVRSFIAGDEDSADEDDDDEDEDKPTVTTSTPELGEDSAILKGVVTDNGDSEITSYGFYYGTDSSPQTYKAVGYEIDENETFTYELKNLSADTTYYFEAYATNDSGVSYGNILSFRTIGPKPSSFVIGSKNYTIRGTSQTGDVAPYIKDGRTFLPIRAVAYALGLSDSNILWNEAAQTVSLIKDTRVVQLKIGSKNMTINGMSISLDAAPEINSGRTCLPVSLVAQAFGFTASWDASSKTATIK